MEVPDEVGRVLPVPENATSIRAWKFTFGHFSDSFVHFELFRD